MSSIRATLWRSELTRLYLPAAVCFLVLNLTNLTILDWAARHHLIHGTGVRLAANYDLKAHFLLVPVKAALFLIGVTVLLWPVMRSGVAVIRASLHRRDVARTLSALAVCLTLTASLTPVSNGITYAVRSTDPFNQPTDQLYRRLLLPGIANLLHLDGVFYIVLYWAIVIVAALVTIAYLKRQGVDLTMLQIVSFFTVGIFATAFQVPGYPEIAVYVLAMIALIVYEAQETYSPVQAAAFALALMAHEACAVIVFVPLALFVFSRRSWLSFLALCALYAVTLLSNFSFHPREVSHLQAMVGKISAHDYFWLSPRTAGLGALFSFKLLWLLVPVGLYWRWRTSRAYASLIAVGICAALASTYIATDYSRLVGFASVPLLLCLVQAAKQMPRRMFQTLSLCNIAWPSFYVGANTGVIPFAGLYNAVYRHLFHLQPTGIH